MNLLAPFGWLYGRIAEARNSMYESGWLRSYDLGARTISVGNITTGGTGKTPLVALVAGILAENGEKVCILTRGYGRENPSARVLVSDWTNVLVDANTGGDEPVELAHKLLGKALVVADADRVAAARWAKEKFGITGFVLDDGFQHRRAKRDVDIVCVDGTNPFGNDHVLPAGRLRESIGSLRRADAIVITRANLVENSDDVRSRISNLNSLIFTARNKIISFLPIDEFLAVAQNKRHNTSELNKPFAFCGLGNTRNFFDQLTNDSIALAGTRSFADHRKYDAKDVEAIESAARKADADCLVTTAKDAVKLSMLKFEIPCYVAVAETVIDDENFFRKLIISS